MKKTFSGQPPASSPQPLDMRRRTPDLWWIAQASAVVVAVIAAAALLYLLIDILLILFLGIVVAAALQPMHTRLCSLGVPKAPAVLLIYCSFFVGLLGVAILVTPTLVEQATRFATQLPSTYADFRMSLETSSIQPLRLVGRGMPPFERMTLGLMQASPDTYRGLLGATTSAVGVFAFIAFVLVVGFYWTLELPRIERLVLSYVPLARRPQALNTWHEMELKLGASMRVQGLTMLLIGGIATVGYTLMGLEGALALGVLAGLLEAIPVIGPVVAVTPAVFVALPHGLHLALGVLLFFGAFQLLENTVIIPRLMRDTVGVSALVALFALLAFGTLYGVLGAFIAVPMTAMIQVLLESELTDQTQPVGGDGRHPAFAELAMRLRAVREQARLHVRGRDSRMGIDPASADHVVDVVDQQIEGAAERIEGLVAAAADGTSPLAEDEQMSLLGEFDGAVAELEQAVGLVAASTDLPRADLDEATEQVGQALERVESVSAAAAEASPSTADPDLTTPSKRFRKEEPLPARPARG